MPTVLSVTLALGAYQLAKHGAIVARMSAVEEMAGMDILCSDKTGTLTLNKLSIDLSASFPMGGTDVNTLVKYGALSADVGSEEAIDVVLHNTYPDPDGLWKGYRRLKFIPFNPNDKFTMAVIEDERTGQVFRLMKGAPQVVLKRAYDFAEIHAPVEQKIIEYANRGYRALGFGIASGAGAADAPGTKWEFLGLLPLFDPPRHDTAETIERCLEKGISVKMVTGDQQLIGKETARQLGMGTNIHKIEVLLHAKAGTGLVEGHSNVDELVEGADGFAEVFPEHKFEIVRILQDRNHMVGMTGDGVNDAPALKKADVGIAVHGATEAARGAADIVLTEPGLSVIVEAVIGARKIFQRMTTYAKYTVAMTFRICFTFGILTIAYNWYFPTILIVLLAVFNDGAMIALSKDRVQPSPMPNSWRLRDIFIIGIVYGLYLTISTWVLYHVASHGIFFQRDVHMFSLNVTPGELIPFCTQLLAQRGITNVNAPMSSYAAQLGQQYATVTDTALSQCMVEQRYVRGAQLRALIYNQVSVSGQALVFVVRTARHSFLDRAGGMTYLAFFAAQVASTLIAAFGFNGYDPPAEGITNCQLCVDSTFNYPHFWPSRTVPIASTESVYTASVIGCTYWIVVAWIWSIIWYMALDPIKWLLMWLLNEEGWRDKHIIRDHLTRRRRHPAKTGEEHYVQVGAAAANHLNPMGRASLQKVDPHTLSRASVIKIETGPQGLRRVSAGPYRLSLEAQQQQFGNLAPGATLANPHPIRRVSLTGRGSFSGEVPNATSRRGSMESVGGHPYRRGSAESIGMRGSSERAGLQMGQAAGHGPSQNGATQKPAGGV
eukprot:GHUV01000839.1.p1 GENE.GHUV01000839.1~~GHUV01000839.1.p1  ORF type:complete len:832 (+),score=189.21 GHUV01000839.1:2414-4909(+)